MVTITKNNFEKQLHILDAFIIFLNISNTYTIIPYLLFTPHRAINTTIVAIINVLYLFFRFRATVASSFFRAPLFILFVTINIFGFIAGLLTNTFGWGILPYFVSNIFFYIILETQFQQYTRYNSLTDSINLIIRGYLIFCILNIAVMLLLWVLIAFFSFYPKVNDISDTMDLFKSNVNAFNTVYYYPLHISILNDTLDIRIPFFQQYGIICGFSHEPHCITYLIIPSLFIFLHKARKIFYKIVIISIYIIIILMTASTTNILSFLICLIVFLSIKFRESLLLPSFLAGLVVLLLLNINNSSYQFIFDKLESRSAEYSMSTMKYAFTPKTIMGYSFYDLTYWDNPFAKNDVGFVIFFLNISFLAIFISRIIKLIFSIGGEERSIGFVALYFLLHSTKIALPIFGLSYLVFIIFLVHIYSKKHSQKKL